MAWTALQMGWRHSLHRDEDSHELLQIYHILLFTSDQRHQSSREYITSNITYQRPIDQLDTSPGIIHRFPDIFFVINCNINAMLSVSTVLNNNNLHFEDKFFHYWQLTSTIKDKHDKWRNQRKDEILDNCGQVLHGLTSSVSRLTVFLKYCTKNSPIIVHMLGWRCRLKRHYGNIHK